MQDSGFSLLQVFSEKRVSKKNKKQQETNNRREIRITHNKTH